MYVTLNYSIWPLLFSVSLMFFTTGGVLLFVYKKLLLLLLASINIIFVLMLWWTDIIYESNVRGEHTQLLMDSYYKMMMFFITTEIFFFATFFSSYMYMYSDPSFFMGMTCPPYKIYVINPFTVPLLNTCLLLMSSMMVTSTHYNILTNNHQKSVITLLLTVSLGLTFLMFQMFEYKELKFSINDSMFTSLFYVTTGFHGTHVLIGSLMLVSQANRMMYNQLSSNHHFALEGSIWYWHFVDVVWLLLYVLFYWWSWLMNS